MDGSAPHTLTPEEAAKAVDTDIERGLSTAEAAERLSSRGPNVLARKPRVSAVRRLLRQFNNPIIGLLAFAAILAGFLGEGPETVAILAIVLLNGFLGFFHEDRAERALESLRTLAAPTVRVVRDGSTRVIAAADLVPGDLIELDAGDHVSADARLVSASGLRAREASLTGESTPVSKDHRAVLPAETALADRVTMVYMGTMIAAGHARAAVVATGMDTELGRIASLLEQAPRESTPLQKRLTELGRVLLVACLIMVAVIFALQIWRGGNLLEVLMVTVSLAVAAVPEGLPAVITVALALGVQRLARRGALVRTLSSVETLGAVTTICTDKTGTLTCGEMTVRAVVAGDRIFEVTGTGYRPEGKLQGSEGSEIDPADWPALRATVATGALCNHADLETDAKGAWQAIGDPTEAALLVLYAKASGENRPAGRIVSEIPFAAERRAMSVVVEAEGRRTLHMKGAPEVVLDRCVAEMDESATRPLPAGRRDAHLKQAAELAGRGLRVLAMAHRVEPPRDGIGHSEKDLVFSGLVGMMDPPRPEVREAVDVCRRAGMRPVMMTGDHPRTAMAVARELGIAGPEDQPVTGPELEAMSPELLEERAGRAAVYARVSAEHKLLIVRALQKRGQRVAMTGDGVNDAPAIRTAEIGVAMGRTGTDVTREASDIVLLDDNFATIVEAVRQGRATFDNIRNFLKYLLSCNASEVLLMFAASLTGWPSPLVPTQILWINLLSDGPPALALAMEPPEPDVMKRPPRPPHEPVITRALGLRMLGHGLLMAAVGLIAFRAAYQGGDLARARTAAFVVVVLSQICYAMTCRSPHRTMPELGPFSNSHLLAASAISVLLQLLVMFLPWTQRVFAAHGDISDLWPLLIVLSLAPVTVIEIAKLVRTSR